MYCERLFKLKKYIKNLDKWALCGYSKDKVSYSETFYLWYVGGAEMNKTELIAAMAEVSGVSKKDTEAVLKAFTEVVSGELKNGGKIQLIGFGTFEVSERAAREGRNPLTGEAMKIAAAKAPKFKAGKALKDLINA